MNLESFVRDRFHYSPETGLLFRRYKSITKITGHKNKEGYLQVGIRLNGKNLSKGAHQIAWFLTYGYFPDCEIDHINQVKNDNRITNLRLATNSQNKANMVKFRNNKSGFKGVYFDRKKSKYRAHIMINYKKYQLGYFDTAEEASLAYDEKAKEVFGDFAFLNSSPQKEKVRSSSIT